MARQGAGPLRQHHRRPSFFLKRSFHLDVGSRVVTLVLESGFGNDKSQSSHREAERPQHSETEALHATQQRATWRYRPSLSPSIRDFFLLFWWTGVPLCQFFHSFFLFLFVSFFCSLCRSCGSFFSTLYCFQFFFSLTFYCHLWSFFSFAHGGSSDAVSLEKETCSAHVSIFCAY